MKAAGSTSSTRRQSSPSKERSHFPIRHPAYCPPIRLCVFRSVSSSSSAAARSADLSKTALYQALSPCGVLVKAQRPSAADAHLIRDREAEATAMRIALARLIDAKGALTQAWHFRRRHTRSVVGPVRVMPALPFPRKRGPLGRAKDATLLFQ